MARFRKIDVRLRSDEKFQALSAPEPNAQDLWIYVLTNRYTSNIPGLYAAYEEAMARDLKWSMKPFRERFGELFRHGLAKADWTVGLVFIPNAIKYDPPANPNVVKGWRAVWDELPECDLKNQAHDHIYEFLKRLGKPYAEPFAERCPKGSGNRMPKPEQEQEPEQEQDHPCSPKVSEVDFERVYRLYPRKEGKSPGFKIAKREIKTSDDLALLEQAIRSYAALMKSEGREKTKVKHFGTFMNCWRDYLETEHSGNGSKPKQPAFNAFTLVAEPPPKDAA